MHHLLGMFPTIALWYAAIIIHLVSAVDTNTRSDAIVSSNQYNFSAQESQCIAVDWTLDPWLPKEQTGASVDASDARLNIPSLTQYYYNSALDVHSTISAKDVELIFSPNGNWQLAMYNLLHTTYFPANPSVKNSYLITTSPPISDVQMENGLVKVGNVLYNNAFPHLVAAPPKFIAKLQDKNYILGDPIPIIETYGNVILKRKGDESILSFWDMRKIEPGKFASSVPLKDSESYNNYRSSVYNIALNNPRSSGLSQEQVEMDAKELVERLFDTDPTSNVTKSESGAGVVSIGPPMHRSIPHCIATGQADGGLFFLHLAVYAMINNPGVFEVVYLGNPTRIITNMSVGTSDASELAFGQTPLKGNKVGSFSVARTTTKVNEQQHQARENMIRALQSDDFTAILQSAGMKRPNNFASDYVVPLQHNIGDNNGENENSSGFLMGVSHKAALLGFALSFFIL